MSAPMTTSAYMPSLSGSRCRCRFSAICSWRRLICRAMLIPEVFEGCAASDVERNKLVRQLLALRGRECDFASLERVPNFTGQTELIAQGLQDQLGAGE